MEKENVSFKCPNELRVTVKKEKEVIIDEDCCTMLNIMLKNDGQLGTSFFGSHNPQIIKVLEMTMKRYFKNIKKTLKQQYRENNQDDDIKVVEEDLPEDKKMQPNVDDSSNSTESGTSADNKVENITPKKSKQSSNRQKQSTTKQKTNKKVKASPKSLNTPTKLTKKGTM